MGNVVIYAEVTVHFVLQIAYRGNQLTNTGKRPAEVFAVGAWIRRYPEVTKIGALLKGTSVSIRLTFLVHAAWIVALADDKDEFELILEDVMAM